MSKSWQDIARTKFTGTKVNLKTLETIGGDPVWIQPKKLPLDPQRRVTQILIKKAAAVKTSEKKEGQSDDEYTAKRKEEITAKIRAGEIEFDPWDEEMQETLKLSFLHGVADHNFMGKDGEKAKWDETLYNSLREFPNILTEIMGIVQDYNNSLVLDDKKKEISGT